MGKVMTISQMKTALQKVVGSSGVSTSDIIDVTIAALGYAGHDTEFSVNFTITETGYYEMCPYGLMIPDTEIDYDLFLNLVGDDTFYIGTNSGFSVSKSNIAYIDGDFGAKYLIANGYDIFLAFCTNNKITSVGYYWNPTDIGALLEDTGDTSDTFIVGDVYEFNFGKEGLKTYLNSFI